MIIRPSRRKSLRRQVAEAEARSRQVGRLRHELPEFFRGWLFESLWLRCYGPGDERGRPIPQHEVFLPGYAALLGNGAAFTPWRMPANMSEAMITCWGAGGPGGVGFSTGGTTGGGGGGGASGGGTTLRIDVKFLPKVLYLYAGANYTSALRGGDSLVTDYPISAATAANTIIIGSGGGVPTAASATTGGTGGGGAIDTAGEAAYSQMGEWFASQAMSGANGGNDTPTAGGSITQQQVGFPFTGGAGGSGTSGSSATAGGDVQGTGQWAGYMIPGGSVPLPNAFNGVSFNRPRAGLGGGGGASGTTGGGGVGGTGGWCSGGGGGGAGNPGGAAGLGGRGFIYIVVW